MGGMSGHSRHTTFVISVAAELAGMHPQTLRQYDRLGLVTPLRTKGRGRRYTQRHVDLLREVQRLSQDEGINLAGIQRILELQNQVEALRAERDNLLARLHDMEDRRNRVFAADASGQVLQYRRGERPHHPPTSARPEQAQMVVWDPFVRPTLRRVRGILEPPSRTATGGPRKVDDVTRNSAAHTIIEMDVDEATIRIITDTDS